MEGEELREGKERVRRVLIDPLVVKGMQRRPGQTVADHGVFLENLEARLAYMSAENLAALSDVVELHAGGRAKNRWPTEVSICNWARRWQKPPASQSRLVRTYLQSAAGRAALAGDYVVELFDHLKRHGNAPTAKYETDMIKARADENRRARAVYERRRDRGLADRRELAELEAHAHKLAICKEIIQQKERAEP